MQLSKIPIFVINLKTSADRRAEMTNKLEAEGLSPQFIDAVDGRKFNVAEIKDYDRTRRLRYVGKDLKPAEIGCFLSHRSAYQRIVDEDLAGAVILEDDAILAPGFAQVLAALEPILDSADMFRFAGTAKLRKARQIAPLTKTHTLGRLNNTASSLLGILMTRAGAEKALAYTQTIVYPIDVAINRFWENGIDQLAVTPLPITHDWDIASTIGDARFDQPPKEPGLRGRALGAFRFYRRQKDSLAKRAYFLSKRSADQQLRRKLSPHPSTE